MKKIILFAMAMAFIPFALFSQGDINYGDFEDGEIAGWANWGGTHSITANPDPDGVNDSDSVLMYVPSGTWKGIILEEPFTPITSGHYLMTVDVYVSGTTGIKFWLQDTAITDPVDHEAYIWGIEPGNWHRLEFSIGELTHHNYKAIVFQNSENVTVYFDNIIAHIKPPEDINYGDFEDGENPGWYSWNAGDEISIVDNPDPNHVNNSDKVLRYGPAAEWGSIARWINDGVVTEDHVMITVDVYSSVLATIKLQMDNPASSGAPQVNKYINDVEPGEWVQLRFDISDLTAHDYRQFAFQNGNHAGDATVYFDNIMALLEAPVDVESITVTGEGGADEIDVSGGTLQMLAEVLPAEATNKSITWSVDNEVIATIDQDGLLTAISDGIVTVKASANDISGVFGELAVTVSNQPPLVLATEIIVTGEGDAIEIDEPLGSLQMSAEILPAEATIQSVNWSVDVEDLATIDENGLLTAKANGVVNVIATAKDGSGVTGNLEITLSNQPIWVTSITVSSEGDVTEIDEPGATLQMSAEVEPVDATDPSINWSVDDEDLASIDEEGLLKAIANGVVTVIATANDGSGVSGNMEITISNQPTWVTGIVVTVDGGMTQITGLDPVQMYAEISPEDASDTTVTWSVSDEAVATIDEDGLLTPVDFGEVTVKATANDGSEVSDSLVLEFLDPSGSNYVIITRETFGNQTFDTDGPHSDGFGSHYKASDPDIVASLTSWNGHITGGSDNSIRINSYNPDWDKPDYWRNPTGDHHCHMGIRTNYLGSWDTTMLVNVNIESYTGLVLEFGYARSRELAEESRPSLNVLYRLDEGDWVQMDTSLIDQSKVYGKWDYITIPLPEEAAGETLDIMFASIYHTGNDEQFYIDDITLLGWTTAEFNLVDSIVVSSPGDVTTIDTNRGTLQLSAQVYPEDADVLTYTWSVRVPSEGGGDATIDDEGLLTAQADGIVYAQAISTDVTNPVIGELQITISNQLIYISSITITTESTEGFNITTPGGTNQLIAATIPNNPSDPTVTWSVDDESIATIDSEGLLTAVANGTVQVTATANDEMGVTGTRNINITNQTVGINLISNMFKVYPNPASSMLNITGKENIKQVELFSMDGRKVLSSASNVDRNVSIDISNLRAGNYVVKITTEDNKIHKGMVIKN